MTLLSNSTLYIRETYHAIDPTMFPPVQFFSGRPLNLPESCDEDDAPVSADGHKIVCVNEIFEDSHHSKFRVIDVLGNGTFSYVFKCQQMQDPFDFVGLKVIKNHPQYHATGVSEIMIHELLNHAPDAPGKRRVISPISTFEIDGHICMVMPLLGRSLFEGLGPIDTAPELLKQVRTVTKQLLEALAFIHSCGVTHCDVKPDNILYVSDEENDIMLIDFGSATTAPTGRGQYIQSRFYRSPEVMLGLPYTSQIDVWSAGCVIVELFLDFALFACDTESDAIHSMSILLGAIPERLLATSQNWRKFYDMTQQGFRLKMDPTEVLLQKHLYHTLFEQSGAIPLGQLIMEHCQLRTSEEIDEVRKFVQFVTMLLEYDPVRRLTAEQALTHPFVTGEPFKDDWRPVMACADVDSSPSSPRMARSASDSLLSPKDFLSMM